MADLSRELEELHASVVSAVRQAVDADPSGENLRVALQLLKQNSITASMAETDTSALKSRMAGKLNFSAMQEKVIPIRPANAS